jgi:GrpB-like predicted nucleotidyltransferase (UPF0157 family)
MPVAIVPYNPNWPAEFVALARPLRERLGSSALRIDHIGSTAVPGLAAKDKIDIQVTLQDLDDLEQIDAIIASFGYAIHAERIHDHRPPGATGPDSDWEKSILSAPPDMRPANIHVRATGRPNQRYPLLFRDYLRAHPVAVGAYAEIKRQLARYHPDDLDFYYDIKDPVCDVIIDAAEDWARQTGWEQGPADM